MCRYRSLEGYHSHYSHHSHQHHHHHHYQHHQHHDQHHHRQRAEFDTLFPSGTTLTLAYSTVNTITNQPHVFPAGFTSVGLQGNTKVKLTPYYATTYATLPYPTLLYPTLRNKSYVPFPTLRTLRILPYLFRE